MIVAYQQWPADVYQILFNVGTGIGFITVHYGFGRHDYYLSLEQISRMAMWLYIERSVLILSPMFTKLSICIFLLRIFQTKRAWRWTLYSLVILVTAIGLIMFFLTFVSCQPIEKLWSPQTPGRCFNQRILQVIAILCGGKYTYP